MYTETICIVLNIVCVQCSVYLFVVGMSFHHLIGFPVQVRQNPQCSCLPGKVIGLHIHTQVLEMYVWRGNSQSECRSHMSLLGSQQASPHQSVPLNSTSSLTKKFTRRAQVEEKDHLHGSVIGCLTYFPSLALRVSKVQ